MRLFVALLYLVLTVGAITTVYPFLVMIGESLTSDYDKTDFPVVPAYVYNTKALFGKYADDKFNGDNDSTNASYRTDFAKAEDVVPPSGSQLAPANRIADWNAFFQSQPLKYKRAAFQGITGVAYTPNALADRYQQYLQKHFHGDIRALDRAYTEEDADFSTVFPPFEDPTKHNWLPAATSKTKDWQAFQQTLPAEFFQAVSGDAIFQKWLSEEAYTKVADLNTAWSTKYTDFSQVMLTPKPGGNTAEQKDWETFVRTKFPIRYTVVSPAAQPAYQQFLQGRYHTIEAYNKAYGNRATSFSTVTLPDVDSMQPDGPALIDYVDFLKSAAPLSDLTVDSLETRYRAHLTDQFHMDATTAATTVPPIYAADWSYVQAHAGALRSNYLTRNYGLVIHYLLVHGQAIRTTVIFCVLAVLTALIVNPLCAYALSRYNLSYGTGILLFLLATMSFPGEVTQIPNFLLLKQLGMLNTFYALILPTVASGYSIFLLKGFFDSLPKELYEAGTLDGASEMRMFWAITLPLSKPIFAVIGLGAFTAAYSAFMFAILTCQDPKMWTIMVWMYELQSNSAPVYTMLAGLTLASLPTLLVFIFAQNTIMKGIILPSYK
jgi:multiple sugar transport system permease protein